MAPLEQVPALFTRIRSVRSVCQKCLDLLASRSPAALQKSAEECLVCKGITFHYPNTHNGIEHFSYPFQMGKKYLLTGVSGGGKSTIGQLIAGLYHCEKGALQYPRSAAGDKSVLYVAQKAHVFRDTLRNNITLGAAYSDEEVLEVLNRCCLTEFLAKLPHGLDEVLQEPYSCSGGEAARIHLARAILRRPQILVSDEITANLDAHTANRIDEVLLSLPDVLLITITHKVKETLAERYDEILYLENGRLIESGTMRELVKKKGAFYHLLYKA